MYVPGLGGVVGWCYRITVCAVVWGLSTWPTHVWGCSPIPRLVIRSARHRCAAAALGQQSKMCDGRTQSRKWLLVGGGHGGVCSSVLDTNPRGVGEGVREGGVGVRKFISTLGAFF